MARNDGVFSRIVESYRSSLTEAERRIADYILKNPHEAVLFSVAMLAEKTSTSEATVVRFARSIGFSGFLELKNQLLERAKWELSQPDRSEQAESQPRTIPSLVVELEMGNLRRTMQENNESSFLTMAMILNGAGLVYTLGLGISSLLARLAAYQLTVLGRRSIGMQECLGVFEQQLELANPHSDVLWVFTFPPYSPEILASVEYARARGMRVVAVTDRPISPVASMVDAVLYAANSNIIALNSITSATTLITALLAWLASEERRTEYAHNVADAIDKAMR